MMIRLDAFIAPPRLLTLALAGVVALTAGCATSARHAPLPPVQMPANWTSPAAPAAAAADPQWWRTFDDPVLDQLIEDALRTNNNLAAAAIRVYRAQLQAGLADANLTPSVAIGASAAVTRTLDTHQMTQRSNVLTGSVSYVVDLWGNLAAQSDVAHWEAQATDADREAAQLSLIGTTAQLYWQLGYLNQLIAIGDANIKYAEQTLALVRSRYTAGAAAGLDVAQAEQTLSQQRASQTQLIQQRTEARNALAILFDRPPQIAAAEPSTLPTQPLPEVRAGLPADLLARRPDLRATEFRLRESLANVDITRTSFYPTLTLTGGVGTMTTSLSRFLQNPVGTLGAGITLPFIQWNTMQLQIKVSRTKYEEAVVNFRQALYNALSDVENALSARVQLDSEAVQRKLSLDQAQRAESLARARYQAGATDVQPWLDQQSRLRDAQSAFAQNRLNRLNNQMKLYQALGGGTG
jgi:NodT family efflux transporter outer membrane factor (OMF) lipoprotein